MLRDASAWHAAAAVVQAAAPQPQARAARCLPFVGGQPDPDLAASGAVFNPISLLFFEMSRVMIHRIPLPSIHLDGPAAVMTAAWWYWGVPSICTIRY
jgi:hypothetical protein